MSNIIINRNIVDHSFKLGYIFCTTISDLRQMIEIIDSGFPEKLQTILNAEFLNRFDGILKHFEKLLFYESISEDDMLHIRTFVNEAKIQLQSIINELEKDSLPTDAKPIISKLLNDMLDY